MATGQECSETQPEKDGASVMASSGFGNPLVAKGGSLVYPSIHSPDFVHNVSGWTIKKDGSAEFNDLVIRGTFFGADFEINSLGAFFYSGAPATGNLIASIAGTAGANDGHGNAFKAGITSYGVGGSFLNMLNNDFAIGSNAADTGGHFSGGGGQINTRSGVSGGGDTNASVVLISKFLTLGGVNPQVLIGPTATPNSLTGEMGEVQGNLAVSGIVTAIDPVNSGSEAWHTLGTLSNYTVTRGRFRINSEGELKLDVDVNGNGSNVGTTTFSVTLPAAYRPAVIRRATLSESGRAITAGDQWPTLQVNTTGTVQVIVQAGITSALHVNVSIPLD
jgi:hypothetical protein